MSEILYLLAGLALGLVLGYRIGFRRDAYRVGVARGIKRGRGEVIKLLGIPDGYKVTGVSFAPIDEEE